MTDGAVTLAIVLFPIMGGIVLIIWLGVATWRDVSGRK